MTKQNTVKIVKKHAGSKNHSRLCLKLPLARNMSAFVQAFELERRIKQQLGVKNLTLVAVRMH